MIPSGMSNAGIPDLLCIPFLTCCRQNSWLVRTVAGIKKLPGKPESLLTNMELYRCYLVNNISLYFVIGQSSSSTIISSASDASLMTSNKGFTLLQ